MAPNELADAEDTELEDKLPPQQDEDVADQQADDDSGHDAEVEARARRAGWVPESDWDDARAQREGRRKPKYFVSAQEYLDRVENEMPILRSTLKSMDKKLEESLKRIDEMHSVFDDQRKMTARAIEKARADERAKLEREMDAAVETADTEAYKAAKDKIAKFEAEDDGQTPAAEKKPEAKPGERPRNPAIDGWLADNADWYQRDPYTTPYMTERYGEYERQNPGNTAENLRKAKDDTIRKFPERFSRDNPNRQAPSAVGSPTGQRPGGTNSVDRRFAALPREDQMAYERQKSMLEKRGAKFTKAQFLEDYGL